MACTSTAAGWVAAMRISAPAALAAQGACAAFVVAAATSSNSSTMTAEGARELMKAAISIFDCSIICLTLGENLTPEEKSLASLLMSGPFEAAFLEPS
jgi:hypothetical protein